jgi:hypothetical protein
MQLDMNEMTQVLPCVLCSAAFCVWEAKGTASIGRVYRVGALPINLQEYLQTLL